jgi:asparagine synthase (glutamine-hydrolysing)
MRAATLVDIKSFIPFNLMQCADRASMTNSLELRSPYLATRLIHFNVSLDTVNRLHEGGFKPLVKKAYRELIPEIILNTNRKATKKKVFNPPIYDYMKKNLDLLTEYLLGTAAQSPKLLNPSFLSEQLDAFRSGAKDNSAFLWGLAILECWLRRNPTTYDREDWLFAKIEAKTI